VATATFSLVQPSVLTSISASTMSRAEADQMDREQLRQAEERDLTPITGCHRRNKPDGNGLSAGSYTVTVTDSHGCTSTQNINITQPVPLTLTQLVILHVQDKRPPFPATGGGGVPPYTYVWSNGRQFRRKPSTSTAPQHLL